MTLGEKITEKRKELKLSQEQLAEKLSVSRSAVAKWESDKGIPDIENLKALSHVLNISIDSLLENQVAEKQSFRNEEQIIQNSNNSSILRRDEKIQEYISKKCTVELTDWNDGICDGYLIRQDDDFLYYMIPQKEKKVLGCLAKKFITTIKICSEKDGVNIDLQQYNEMGIEFFVEQKANIYTNEKHIWSGILGKDTEFLNVEIISFSNGNVTLEKENEISDIVISMKEIVKIEIV